MVPAIAAALALAAPAAPASPHVLYAWSSAGGGERAGGRYVGISRRWFGPSVPRLAPGRYTIHLHVDADTPFQLHGPGINRLSGPGPYETWRVRLRAGRYVYRARGSDAALSSLDGFKISGRLVVG